MKIIADKSYIVQEGQPIRIAFREADRRPNDEEGPQER